MERRYNLLKNKYNELLLPTLFTIFLVHCVELCDYLRIFIRPHKFICTFFRFPFEIYYLHFLYFIWPGRYFISFKSQINVRTRKNKFLFYNITFRYSFNVHSIYFVNNILYRRTTLNTSAEIINISRDYYHLKIYYLTLLKSLEISVFV